ncbi:MAG: EAL domain-containing protein, partial [Candidatus Eremiobacteraeota bacterium]|nr:EAL domain-containing protein [Candidatus Eremiobacteraeota bacterium]
CWQRIGYSPRLYINLSSLDKSLLSQLDALAERERFDQSCVSLEMSETLIMRDYPSSEHFLEGCRVRGLRVGIDRFGSGTSSLKQLASLPIDFIKLDHALVGCLFRDAKAAAILDANIQIGKSFGWKMIAEGVETPEQRDWLIGKGVEGLQGYNVGYPMTTVDFESRLRVDGAWDGRTASA